MVLVPQRMDGSVRVYDTAGRRVAVLGRSGSGPCEFRRLSLAGWTGDTVWVADKTSRRLTYFPDLSDGACGMDSHPVQVTDYMRVPIPFGDALLTARAGAPPSEERMTPPVYVVVDEDWREIREIAAINFSAPRLIVNPGGTAELRLGPQPFVPYTLSAVAPDRGMLVLLERHLPDSQHGYRLIGINATGDTVFDRFWPIDRWEITNEVVDRALDPFVGEGSFMQKYVPTPSAGKELIRKALLIPDQLPPASRVVIGADGSIWVRGVDDYGPELQWTVFSPVGQPIGRALLPRKWLQIAPGREGVWVETTGEFGEPYLTYYRTDHFSLEDGQ